MPVSIGWPEIALRLALAVLAGALLGLNRTQRGMTAGLWTTLLVCLAAAVSMLQVNLLLGVAGRPPDSFVMMNLMRLPLGILTGMGFIGAGAILRRGDLVTGVTTAATLWLATVLGLCFGGGQHGLGLAGLVVGLLVLWVLKGPEVRIKQERRALLILAVAQNGPTDDELRSALAAAGYQVASWDAAYRSRGDGRRRKVRSQVQWQARLPQLQTPEFVRQLAQRPGVLFVRWKA
jgi:putative Mg2+ transporter-C (MgtC) family protein